MGLMCDSRTSDSIHTKTHISSPKLTSTQPCSALPLSSPSAPPSTRLWHLLTSHRALPLFSWRITTPLGWIWVSHQVPWTRGDQPCLRTEASQLVSAQVWSRISWLCSTGAAVWGSSKCLESLHWHQTQGFLTFSMTLLLLPFSHHPPSFLSPRKEDPSVLSRALQQIYSANRAPSAVCGCLKLQENTNTTIKTEGVPSSPGRLHQLTLHDTFTLHFAAHCLI